MSPSVVWNSFNKWPIGVSVQVSLHKVTFEVGWGETEHWLHLKANQPVLSLRLKYLLIRLKGELFAQRNQSLKVTKIRQSV